MFLKKEKKKKAEEEKQRKKKEQVRKHIGLNCPWNLHTTFATGN